MELIKVEPILEEINKQKTVIAGARDKLNEIKDELETEIETFDEAIEDLESATDLLSQYV